MDKNVNDNIEVFGIDEIERVNTKLDDIDSENVTLINLNDDESGSMTPYVKDMKDSLAGFKDAIANTKEAESNEILIARGRFSSNIDVKGYKPVGDFDTDYKASGMTSLYDAVIESKEKLVTYMTHLKDQGMRVKAVFAFFSDGEDTSSRHSLSEAKAAIEELNAMEVVTAFMGFGGGANGIADSLGFRNKISVGDSASELRASFNVLSKSVVEASKNVTSSVDDPFFID